MSNYYRGFNRTLTARVARAEGDRHYFDRDTLEFFDAYGHDVLSRGPDHVTMVDSIRDTFSDTPREYRVIEVKFHRDPDTIAEVVTVDRPTDNYPTVQAAIDAYRAISTTEGN